MPRNRPIYLAREPSKLRFWSEIPPELAPLPPLWGQGAGGWGFFDAPKKVVGASGDRGGYGDSMEIASPVDSLR